jgi:hypothetical protein
MLLALAIAANCAVAAHAADTPDAMAPAFGNTVVVTYPDGLSQRLWLQNDGSWVGQSRHGNARRGRWTLTASGNVCLKQSQPKTLPLSYCTPFPRALRVGLRWNAKDVLGRPVEMSLVNGVQSAAQGVQTAEAPKPAV